MRCFEQKELLQRDLIRTKKISRILLVILTLPLHFVVNEARKSKISSLKLRLIDVRITNNFYSSCVIVLATEVIIDGHLFCGLIDTGVDVLLISDTYSSNCSKAKFSRLH